MKFCIDCNMQLAESNQSGRCRSCAQKLAVSKRESTCLARYGARNVMHIDRFVKKIQHTFLERYNAKCAMDVPEFKQKQEDTMIKLYDVKSYVLTDKYMQNAHFRESDTQKAISSKLNQLNIQTGSELLLADKKFDISILGANILLEIDPSYTHNIIGNHWNKNGLDENYHLNKTAVAAAHGYHCIHVFDWDDLDEITNRLCILQKIAARKCEVVLCNELTPTVELTYEDKVVLSVQAQQSNITAYEYELIVMFKPHVQVIGGVSRAIKHMIQHLRTNKIFIRCDLSKFSGECFEKANMKTVAIIPPQEHWSKNTYETQLDDEVDAEKLIQNHWLPVYDCGYAIYSFVEGYPVQTSQPSLKEYYQSIANAISKSKERLCDFCGLPFIPASNRQRYCKRIHKRICPICNKEYVEDNVENLKRPPIACSYECRVQKTKATSLIRYGCEAPGNSLQARRKAEETRKRNKTSQ